jgi:hypothetical protein
MFVNDIPPCDAYTIGVYMAIEEAFPGSEYGRPFNWPSEGTIACKVDGVILEFAATEKRIVSLPLRDASTASFVELPDGVELPSHDDISLTGLQDWGARPGVVLPGTEPPDEEPGVAEPPPEVIETPPPPPQQPAIPQEDMNTLRAFFAEELGYGDVRFSLLFQSYYVFYDLSVSGGMISGMLQGASEHYPVVIRRDFTLSMPDAAWSEYPSLSIYRYEEA